MAKSINFIMDLQGNDHAAGLSANAAVFIPRNYGPPIGTAPIQTIPTYMTNCFPFVQPDFNGNRLGGNHGNWSRHQRPNRNRNNSGHHGNRFPTPNKFSEPPLFPFTSPPPQDPYFNQFMPPPNNFLINNMTSLPVMPSEGESGFENDINSNNFSSNSRRRRNQRDKNSNNNNNNNVWRSNESIGTDDSGRKTDSSNRQRRRTNSGRKGGTKNDSPRAPVLVLYEREIQTDFSENFAYKTLEEHPSSLYRKSHRRNIHDNRDLNSDSGYSSPLHKRNQITIGTQSDSTLSLKLTSNSIQSDDPSIVHAATVPQQKFSYAFIAQKEPSQRPVINQDNQNSAENLKTGQQKSPNNQNRNKQNPGNRSHDSQLANRNTPNPGNRSHDSQLANRNTSNTYDLNNQHINKQANKKSEVRNKFQGDIQTKQNQVRKTGKTNSDEETRGFSRKGTTSIDENDYGFSRTKNLRSERKQSHESNSNKNNLQEGNKSETGQNLETEGESGTQGKKKRRRRRKRKKKNPDDPADSQDEAEYEPQQEVELHFEDVEEFPDLSSAKALNNKSSGVGISYSAILQTVPVSRPSTVERNKTSSSEESPRKDNSSLEDKGTRASRRRRKRKDILNTAAENELAEIGLEQQMLKEQCLKTTGPKSNKEEKGQTPGILKVNPKTQNSGKKSKQNVSLDLGAVIDALEQKKTTISLTSATRIEQKVKTEQPKKKEVQKSKGGHNVLDASAPIKRGKERETPKAKKPSPLKKVILKEREEKKHLKMLEGTESGSTEAAVGIGVVSAESDLSQDAMSTKSSIDYTGTPGSANLSPVSQTSPISMSPLSPGTSPLSSEVNSPIAGAVGKDVVKKIHSRRFREYCNQVLDKDIDECATTLLQDLVRFQDRMYHKDPSKAKLKRRLVLGLREVAKHLKLRKIKCVIISPNLEKIQSKGGLDDALNNILTLCNEQNVPFVFALGRRALGRACAKMVPVSVVGIFNFSGSEENFKQLIDLTAKARESYGEMVAAIEIEIKEYPMKKQQATTPHVFAHMGHSRTPSGASVLSFTSSILSEPISENYPHSEPETDSKGYEIVKDDALIKQGLPTDSSGYQTQMRIIHSNTKDDDGNEADNEEEGDRINSLRDENQDALPHIDSIHTSGAHDLNTEILSQHSGRTLENCEAMSTHSSRTLGDGSSTILADFGDRSKHGTPKSTESPSNTLQRGKVVDEERIQHWVDETSSRLENLALEEESYEDSTDEMTDSDESEEKYNFEMHNDDSKKKIIDCSAGDSENKNNEVSENCKKLCDSKTDMEKVSEKLLKIASDSCDGEHVNAQPNSCDIVNSSDNSMVEIDSKNCSEKSDMEDSNPLSENSNMADCTMKTDKSTTDMTDISTCDAIQSSDQQNVISDSDTTKDHTRDTNLDKNTTAPTNVEIHFD